MTTNTIEPLVEYIEDGVTTSHPIPFKFLADENLVVTRILDGVPVVLALATHYTATGAGDDAGGELLKSSGGTPSATLRIGRRTPRSQTMDYTPHDTFEAESHEEALDRQSLVNQEQDVALASGLARAMLVPEGETIGELPALADRKGKILTFDPATGDPEASTFAVVYNGTQTIIAENRTVMAALTGLSEGQAIFLSEAGRSGIFIVRLGNYSARVAIDLFQGIYVALNTDPFAFNRVLVRASAELGNWHSDWFGAKHDPSGGNGAVVTDQELYAMFELGNVLKPDEIKLAGKILTCSGPLPDINWLVHVRGSRGSQGTILCKRYDEPDDFRGVLAFRNSGFRLSDMAIAATDGSGGSGFSGILPEVTSGNLGECKIDNIRISGGDFFNYSRVIDGSTNFTSAASYRGVWETNVNYFGAKEAVMYNKSVQHWFGSGLFAQTAGGTSAWVLKSDWEAADPATIGDGIDNDTDAINDDWKVTGVLSGDVDLVGVSRFIFTSDQNGDIHVDADCTNGMWVGHRFDGVVYNNAAVGEFVHLYDAVITARGGNAISGWEKWGGTAGRIRQWGAFTTAGGAAGTIGFVTGQTWPIAFTSSAINGGANANGDEGAEIGALVQMHSRTLTTFAAKAWHFSVGADVASGTNASYRYEVNGQ